MCSGFHPRHAVFDLYFPVSKSLAVFGILVDALGIRFNSSSNKYANLLFDNANTGYAEVWIIHTYLTTELTDLSLFQIRNHISRHLYILISSQWQPFYPSTNAFLDACQVAHDPLRIRSVYEVFYAVNIVLTINCLQEGFTRRPY